MAVVNSSVVCLAETMFGMILLVLRRHRYSGLAGPVPKSSGTLLVGGTRTAPQLMSQSITLTMSSAGTCFPLA